jgi:hypothetical protein
MPNTSVRTPDGDVTLVFLSGMGVSFAEPIDDAWYRAIVPDAPLSTLGYNGTQQGLRPAEAASPLGCVEQWQFCNSSYDENIGCGPLGSFVDAANDGYASFGITQEDMDQTLENVTLSATAERYIWFARMQTNGVGRLDQLLTYLGPKSLASQSLLYSGVQFPIPTNQW